MRFSLRRGVRIFFLVSACAIAGPFAAAPAAQTGTQAATAVDDFNDRIKAYLSVRDKVAGDAPQLKETSDPARIAEAQKALAGLIRNARATAKPGDIFTPAIEKTFRSLLKWEVTATDGATAKPVRPEEQPMVELKVNGDYPSKEPLATVPPAVLQALPALPADKGLEYRFIRKHMILFDTQANLIVDFILNALP